MKEILREIPKISKIIEMFRDSYPEEYVKRAAREVTERYRREIKEGRRKDLKDIYRDIREKIEELMKPSLRRVINATGVVINTNLGRVPLPAEVLEFVEEIGKGYSNLEFNLESGDRGSRISHIEDYLKELTGAESAFVVNNNAGAVYLILNTLSSGKEVLISRGELVEIGGSFRIPDIMRAAGAILKEVGTTNRTRISDYEQAIGENTALLLKVHRSNFYMRGFTQDVSSEELVSLGRRFQIPTYYDVGSGLLLYPRKLKLSISEPSFKACIEAGFDLVSGSGDKLLGGPQAGIVVGRKDLIEKIKKNPVARALRIDKLTLAGLEATLRLYIEGRYEKIPLIRMLTEDERTLRGRANRLRRRLRVVEGIEVHVVRDVAKPGGGSLPDVELPTYCVAVRHINLSIDELSKRLRTSNPPVIGRVKRDRLLLDMRTVFDEDLKGIEEAFREALRG